MHKVKQRESSVGDYTMGLTKLTEEQVQSKYSFKAEKSHLSFLD